VRVWTSAGAVLATVLVAGCATGCASGEPVVDPEVPQFTTSAPPVASTLGRSVPKACEDVATAEEVGTILGMLITGEPQPVVGVPQASIGRTARLDCYYGTRRGRPLAESTVWIALAGYTDATRARQRLTDTISTERDAGSQVNEIPVGSGTGVLLRGRTWTLVSARGKTTVVVTIKPGLVREDRAGAMLGQIADHALTPRDPEPS
jgi:hypothetical protein